LFVFVYTCPMRGQYDKPRYSGSVVAFGLGMQACAASPLIPCGITNYVSLDMVMKYNHLLTTGCGYRPRSGLRRTVQSTARLTHFVFKILRSPYTPHTIHGKIKIS
jgi:hypothetical protein